jgi:hypothetical protein
VSVAWRLEGAGRVVGALVAPGQPTGGWRGARVLAGEGVWPAVMRPTGSELALGSSLIELGDTAVPLVVHTPAGDLPGSVDQPGRARPADRRLAALASDLRRDSRRVRIRAADRVWWLRASGIFGVRVSRGGRPVYTTRGMLGQFHPDTDDLDISVVLLTLASIPSATYAPILGF